MGKGRSHKVFARESESKPPRSRRGASWNWRRGGSGRRRGSLQGLAHISFGFLAPNMTYLPFLQWLLLFNFPRPCRSWGGCALPARGPRSWRLRSSSGLHVHFAPTPLSGHCTSCSCGRHLFTDGSCGPGMPPLHSGQVRSPSSVFSVGEVVGIPGVRGRGQD